MRAGAVRWAAGHCCAPVALLRTPAAPTPAPPQLATDIGHTYRPCPPTPHLVAHLGEEAAQGCEGGWADRVRALAGAGAAPVGGAAVPAVALVRRRPAVPPLQPVLVLLALEQALATDRKGRVLRGHTHRARPARARSAGVAAAASAPGGWCAGAAPGTAARGRCWEAAGGPLGGAGRREREPGAAPRRAAGLLWREDGGDSVAGAADGRHGTPSAAGRKFAVRTLSGRGLCSTCGGPQVSRGRESSLGSPGALESLACICMAHAAALRTRAALTTAAHARIGSL